jgi:hypothetical protein
MQNNQVFRIDDPYVFLTKDLLEKEYIDNRLTDREIAKKYNIGSKTTVWRRRQFYNIVNSFQNKSNYNALKNRKFIISKEDALKWQQEGKTYDEMADIVGCSRMVLYRRFKELGIVTECYKAMNRLRWHERLSDIQMRFLLGDVLGDGNITSCGMYQCNHSYKQKYYVEYKKEVLDNLLSPNFTLNEHVVNNHQNGKRYRCYYLRTMCNEFIKKMYDKFYINKVKVFPYKYLSESNFDAYSLAIWYMDDGSRNNKRASLYTYGFEYCGNLDILRFLQTRFGLAGQINQSKGDARSADKIYFVGFDIENSNKFFQLVSPYILPNFRYKIPEKFRSKNKSQLLY